jgi:hypothetical protein
MALRSQAVIALGLTALLAAGCSISNPFGRDRPRSERTTPVVAAPAPSVTAMPLPPPPGAEAAPPASGLAALDPAAQGTTTGAVPASRDVQLGRTDFLGSWTIAAAGDSCQLSVALTTWTGGYRASTRGCSNTALQSISAWNMEAGQVQLLSDTGATVARLYPASKTQLNGQTEGGGPVSVSR